MINSVDGKNKVVRGLRIRTVYGSYWSYPATVKQRSKEDSVIMVIRNQEEHKHMSLVSVKAPGSRASFMLLRENKSKAFSTEPSTQ